MTLMKIMQELKTEYYEEALITHELNVTWTNIENNLRGTDGRSQIVRDSDWYQKETFQRVLNNVYTLDRNKLLRLVDDTLLKVPRENLLKPHLDELKLCLTTLNFDDQDITQMRIFQ